MAHCDPSKEDAGSLRVSSVRSTFAKSSPFFVSAVRRPPDRTQVKTIPNPRTRSADNIKPAYYVGCARVHSDKARFAMSSAVKVFGARCCLYSL